MATWQPQRPAFALLLAMVAGCVGSIGNSSEEDSAGDESQTTGAGPGGPATLGGGSGQAAVCTGPSDPGTVTLHRLNSVEYDNTVRDLMGDGTHPARSFPVDGVANGFDNEASVLSTSPLLVDKYSTAAKTMVDALMMGAQRAKVMICDPLVQGDACTQKILETFAKKAWRAPLDPTDGPRLLALAKSAVTQGGMLDQGLRIALRAILLSPRFAFRVEIDPSPTSTAPHPLSSHELASRLSYFLWSTMPDDALMTAADANQLTSKEAVAAQVTRMLSDPKSAALTDNFAGQWMGLRQLDIATPNAKFTAFTPQIRADLKTEAATFFRSFVTENKSALELLTADYTYANSRLAAYYGLPSPGSDAFAKVSLAGSPRAGMMTQGAWLTVTSTSARTSPVRRGKYVLGQLFCQEPPPPPPDVKPLAETTTPTGTLRERMAAHRASASCAACHGLMDPIGLAFENFDAIGQYRTNDSGFAIDPAGKLADGRTFASAKDLETVVASDPQYGTCLTSKVFAYAVGRAPSGADECNVAALASQLSTGGFRLADLLQAVAQSDSFRTRHGGL
jgi:hypothetical protein